MDTTEYGIAEIQCGNIKKDSTMIKNDRIIKSIAHGDMIQKIAYLRNIELTEAREIISLMSFNEYRTLEEASADITPPSGQKLAGNTPPAPGNPPGQQSQPAANAPQTAAVPPVTDPRGVQVKNPVTGQMEWQKPGTPVIPGQQQAGTQPVAEDKDLVRLRQLAGIRENSSAGASCAGAIATIATPMGKAKKREITTEQQPVEYTRTEAPKTIVGDTKPAQASGELSANLAARGKKTASRSKNGLRR